ncbi:MAG: helix-turn-helix domain-containing protein [Nanoarchaeota archaeon]|nr:helix-turn-helix domain-containing protein [Nanoarchaeota archaeon]
MSSPFVGCKMYEELLKNIGLTENESKVYLALLKIGISTTSKIIQESKISSGKIYEILDKLHKKSLISTTKIKGIKHFEATSPSALINYIADKKNQLEEKEKNLKEILPKLIKLQINSIDKTSVNIILGEKSIKPLIENLFSNAQEKICVMGIRGTKNEKYNNFWWHLTNEIIEKKKKKALYLFSENTSKYYKRHKKLKQIKIKWLNGITPTAIDIIDNQVLVFSYGEELTCIHITSKLIADSFKSFFMSLWNIAK